MKDEEVINENDLREYLVQRNMNFFSKSNCAVKETNSEIAFDEIIKLFEIINNRQEFYELTNEEQKAYLKNLFNEMANYVGVNNAKAIIHENNKIIRVVKDSDGKLHKLPIISQMDYKSQAVSFNNNYDKANFLYRQLSQVFGEAKQNNVIVFNYNTKNYFDDIATSYKLKDTIKNMLYKVDMASLTTVRHEYEHIRQYAFFKKFYKGDVVPRKYMPMAIMAVMQHSLEDLKGSECMSEISYFMSSMEVDARLSEIELGMDIIGSGKASQDLKDSMFKLLEHQFMQNFNLKNEAKLSDAVKLHNAVILNEFKKEFGQTDEGQKLISFYEDCKTENYYKSIDFKFNNCVEFFEKMDNQKRKKSSSELMK